MRAGSAPGKETRGLQLRTTQLTESISKGPPPPPPPRRRNGAAAARAVRGLHGIVHCAPLESDSPCSSQAARLAGCSSLPCSRSFALGAARRERCARLLPVGCQRTWCLSGVTVRDRQSDCPAAMSRLLVALMPRRTCDIATGCTSYTGRLVCTSVSSAARHVSGSPSACHVSFSAPKPKRIGWHSHPDGIRKQMNQYDAARCSTLCTGTPCAP